MGEFQAHAKSYWPKYRICYDWLRGATRVNNTEIFIEGTNPLTPSVPQTLSNQGASLQEIRDIAEHLAKTLDDDKAEDVLFIELEGKSSLADFMIIASGRSGRHVASLASSLAIEAKKITGRPASVEGMPNADWVLIDTGDVIVHLFRPEVRDFYNLEKIWASETSSHRGTAN